MDMRRFVPLSSAWMRMVKWYKNHLCLCIFAWVGFFVVYRKNMVSALRIPPVSLSLSPCLSNSTENRTVRRPQMDFVPNGTQHKHIQSKTGIVNFESLTHIPIGLFIHTKLCSQFGIFIFYDARQQLYTHDVIQYQETVVYVCVCVCVGNTHSQFTS